MTEQITQTSEQNRDALVERLFGAVLGMSDLYMVYIGNRLGFYGALDDRGPATAAAPPRRARTNATCGSGWSNRP